MNHEILTSGEFEKPFNLIDLDAIQAKYPVPNTGFVIDACREVVEDSLTEASKGEHQQITRLKNELFGDRASKVDHGIFAGTPPEILARGLFVATLHEAVPVSTDFEQFKWRLDTFFGDKILDGEIVGDVPVVSHNNLYRENWSRRYKFDRTCRRKFAVIQTARYCSIHQDQEEAAIDYFMSTLENVRTGQEIKLHWPLVTESEIEYARTCLREGRRIQPTPDRKVYDRLLERISAKVQWRRKETPKDWTSPSLKNLVSDLELLPVDRIPPGELSSVYKTITNPKFKPDKPILLIPPSLKATRNFLKSLVKSETDYKTLTGKLLARFEAFEGDELIVYSDAIKIANR